MRHRGSAILLLAGLTSIQARTTFGYDPKQDKAILQEKWFAPFDEPVFEAAPGQELAGLCASLSVGCGWEKLPSEPPPSERRTYDSLEEYRNRGKADWLDRRVATVEQVLDWIVSRHPKYQYSIRDGVINLTPRPEAARREGYKSPLDKKLPAIELRDEVFSSAEWRICRAGGIWPWHVYFESPASILAGGALRRTSLKVASGTTIRDALNALVREDGGSMWVFDSASQKLYDRLLNLVAKGPMPHQDKCSLSQYNQRVQKAPKK